MPERRALVIGVTGISGGNLAEHLVARGWDVAGVSRRPPRELQGVRHIAVDVTDEGSTREALTAEDPTHVFYCTWSMQDTEAENIDVNGGMLRNVLAAVADGPGLRHVALVTGLKHYLGPFEVYGQTDPPDTPFREEQGRLPYENFYYAQEDVLFEFARQAGYSWSVHRPHTMIGWALGNFMNMGVTLALYGTICRETGRPFVFPGSPEQWNGITDVTDARLLARQLEWAAAEPAAANQAFNIVNGDVFRWRRMWGVLADGLGVEPAPYRGLANPLEQQMADASPVWTEIVRSHGLESHDLSSIASWWHSDADLSRPLETFTDMGKSRRFGFLDYQPTDRSFLDLFDRLRAQRIIPPPSVARASAAPDEAAV
jgi:nucleoside-diphosphate-sugar epimerase